MMENSDQTEQKLRLIRVVDVCICHILCFVTCCLNIVIHVLYMYIKMCFLVCHLKFEDKKTNILVYLLLV